MIFPPSGRKMPALTAVFEGIVCRHLLWAQPDPAETLRRWTRLLAPAGRLLLIVEFWHTGGGLRAAQDVRSFPPGLALIEVVDLSGRPLLWGGPVSDDR